MADNLYINYPVRGPYMDMSVPPNQTKPGVFSRLTGVDGRYQGSLRRFPGMNLTLDLTTVSGLEQLDTEAGIKHFRVVGFQKTDTATFYRGFVVGWDRYEDDDLQVDLVYTLNNGTTWSRQNLWAAGSGIGAATELDVTTDRNFMYITAQGIGAKTIYYDTVLAALTVVAMGPGNFYQTLPAATLNTSSVDDTGTYFLRGDGAYQIAYRFYSSTRGVYSALSDVLTVQLDHLKTTYATGYVIVDTAGSDAEFVDTDVLTIAGRTYEFDDNSTSTGDVAIDISALSGDLPGQLQAAANAINGDASGSVYAVAQSSALSLTSRVRGADGNAITLAKTEAAPNQSDLSVSGANLTGGGSATETPERSCKIVIDLPNQGTPSWFDYTDSGDGFADLFDTVEVFRSIDLGFATDGAILYLESSTTIPVEGSWDALTITLGSVIDEALAFYDYYNPSTDIVTAPPASGAIGRYQGTTFMAQALTDEGGLNTFHSSLLNTSGEYFSTYNERVGSIVEGRPLRYIPAGDSMLLMAENSVTHVHKGGSDFPLEYTTHHLHRGLAGKLAAHAVGNSALMLGYSGLMMVNSNSMDMGQISAASRLILDDWKSDLSNVSSGYDGRMDSSFFLSPASHELLQINHTTQSVSLLEAATYVWMDSGSSVDGGSVTRSYFVTATGLIVEVDWDRSGYGNMLGLDPDAVTMKFTGNGSGPATVQVREDSVTWSKHFKGAYLYAVNGNVAGEHIIILSHGIAYGITYYTGSGGYGGTSFSATPEALTEFLVAPVVFKARMPAVRSVNQQTRLPEFGRVILTSIAAKFRGLSGYDTADAKFVRVGGYKDSSDSLHGSTDLFDISQNPAEAIGAVRLDGIDVEPYIEHISMGTDFELTGIDVGVTITSSRKTGSS